MGKFDKLNEGFGLQSFSGTDSGNSREKNDQIKKAESAAKECHGIINTLELKLKKIPKSGISALDKEIEKALKSTIEAQSALSRYFY